jgi:hypothetical protein
MATSDRRRKLTISEINEYWRRLNRGTEQPDVHQLCNAIRVLDLALAETNSALCRRLSVQAWTRIRNDCFDTLITSFAGYFLVYREDSLDPLEPSEKWPNAGRIEFYPEKANRRDDAVSADLARAHPSIVLRLRWCFAEGCQNITPADFTAFREFAGGLDEVSEEERAGVVDEVYEVCAGEALTLRKIAHRKWWHLHYQARGCSDSRQRGKLKKQMDELELIWGRSR